MYQIKHFHMSFVKDFKWFSVKNIQYYKEHEPFYTKSCSQKYVIEGSVFLQLNKSNQISIGLSFLVLANKLYTVFYILYRINGRSKDIPYVCRIYN